MTDAGALSVSGALSGSGSVQISGAGQFTLRGSDSIAGIDFVSGGSNERLDLSAAHLPSLEIQGFGAHDTIDVSGFSHSDTIGVSYKGDVATVRFLQAGKTVGELRFAMKAGQGDVSFRRRRWSAHFCSNPSRVRDRVERSRPGRSGCPLRTASRRLCHEFWRRPLPDRRRPRSVHRRRNVRRALWRGFAKLSCVSVT